MTWNKKGAKIDIAPFLYVLFPAWFWPGGNYLLLASLASMLNVA